VPARRTTKPRIDAVARELNVEIARSASYDDPDHGSRGSPALCAMENPYEPPQNSHVPVGATGRSSKMVGQVPIVAVLLMVQGGLEVVMGFYYMVMAAFIPFIMQQQQKEHPLPQGQNPPPGLSWIMLALFGALGLIVFIAAGLKLYAGWQNFHYRHRVLGIVALASAFASLFTCYCMPTALLLAIYGLIVYLNQDVAQAFTLGQQGYTSEQIQATFAAPPGPPVV
jgi:hypothetical protein